MFWKGKPFNQSRSINLKLLTSPVWKMLNMNIALNQIFTITNDLWLAWEAVSYLENLHYEYVWPKFSYPKGKIIVVHAIHGAKTRRNQTPWYVLLDNFTTRPSFINLYDPLLTKWPEMPKMCCRGEIENVIALEIFYVVNFSSATRGRFSNVRTFLASLATWSKKAHTDFWKMVWL